MMTRSVSTLADTHGLVTRPGTHISATSEGRGWRSLFASEQHEGPFEHDCAALPDSLIVVHLTGPVRVWRRLAGRRDSCLVPPGGLFIMPGDLEFGVRLEGDLDTVHIYLHRSVLVEVASELETGDAEILPELGDRDALLEQIALGLREQLTDNSSGTASMYVDYLARLSAARLIRNHSSRTGRVPRAIQRGALSEPQLRRAIEFIEANLENNPTLPDLAAAVGMRPVRFARQFRSATGFAPHQYLIRTRVDRAKRLLVTTRDPIAAIALECGFCHQEHLTRAFRKHCGTTPAAYRVSLHI
jgi:AraC family transcriptional regulator